ncbi:MAG: hypothetical protein D6805_08490 [Planctomycetota bacterium]|nr:MAG: hypothetical protein D6805_08490 [Planctomycetota bacterium]
MKTVKKILTTILLFSLAAPSLLAQNPPKKILYVVKKGGSQISVMDLLKELHYQLGGKIIIPHPSLRHAAPIYFHSSMKLGYEELRKILSVNGIELIESEENGTPIITAYSTQNIPSLRSGATPFYSKNEPVPPGNRLITKVFAIQHVDPNALYSLLRTMIFQDPKRVGNVFYVRGSPVMILRGFQKNVEYYGRIIQELDKKTQTAQFQIVQLKYGIAEDIARKFNQIVQAMMQNAQQTGRPSTFRPQIIGDKRTNKIILVASPEQMPMYLRMIQALDEKVPEVATKGKLHIIRPKFIKAENLAPKLNELLTGSGSPTPSAPTTTKGNNPALVRIPTRIIAEPKSNTLLIQAEQEEFERIKKLVDKLDLQPPQVLIEAYIFEVEASRSLNIGTELATFDPSVEGSFRTAGITNFGLSQLTLDPNNPNRLGRLPNVLQGVTAVVHKGGFDRLPLIINLLGTDRTTNILAEPFTVTNDNEEAVFTDKTEIPTISRTTNPSGINFTTQQESVEAATTFKITPHISPGNSLRLDIDLKIEDFAAQAVVENTTPPKTSRSYKGSVTVQNGKFLVIGGLSRHDYTETVNKVPILGDIPLLGYLFSNTVRTTRKLNVYIFVRAYILRDEKITDKLTEENLKNAEQQSQRYVRPDLSLDEVKIKEQLRNWLTEPEEDLLKK